MNSRRKKLSVIVFALFGMVITVAPDVLAVVGRPLTPVSYAGVARRTARRSAVYGGGYYGGGYYGGGYHGGGYYY